MIGAIIGDISGSKYEFNNIKSKVFELMEEGCHYTDDTIMTLAVAEILQNDLQYDKDAIIDTIKKWGRAFPDLSYGSKFKEWLFSDSREPYNSFGNGSAMRISPVGWYANSEEEVIDFSKRITEVTHNHPEGIKGAEVVAMCIYYARIGKSKSFIKKYVKKHYKLNFRYQDLVDKYEFNETCQETVPQAIYCFLISDNFKDCIKTTISIGGDCDTTTAISGAIAEAYYKKVGNDLFDKMLSFLPNEENECNIADVLSSFVGYKNSEILKKKRIKNIKILYLK